MEEWNKTIQDRVARKLNSEERIDETIAALEPKIKQMMEHDGCHQCSVLANELSPSMTSDDLFKALKKMGYDPTQMSMHKYGPYSDPSFTIYFPKDGFQISDTEPKGAFFGAFTQDPPNTSYCKLI